jgi:hypothetical protein
LTRKHWRKLRSSLTRAAETPLTGTCTAWIGTITSTFLRSALQVTEIQIEGDARYDPKLVRANTKQQRAAETQALLSGAPAAATSGVVHGLVTDEPQWIVPEVCPECGARVDQSTASVAEHPTCEFCHQPLPCKPVPEDY